MRKYALLLIPFLIALFHVRAGAEEKAVEWQLDKSHSVIGFSARHLGISKVKGHFEEFEAVSVKADPQSGKIAYVEAVAKAGSVNTGIDKRDGHLRSADFFDADKYPDIRLKTTSITWDGDKISIVTDFTMKGVTRTVTFTGEYLGAVKADFGQGVTQRSGYSVEAVVNRKDFGLNFNMLAEGVSVVSDEVRLQLEVEIWRAL